jgi:hypothetical protein
MRVPKNKIQTGKYTSGGEFVELLTNKEYQGPYYGLNNKFYIGKEFSTNAAELIRIQQQNQLYNQSANTALFSFISGITSQALSSPRVAGIPKQTVATTRYFSQQTNVNPITIKEISKETYDSLQGNALYRTTFIGPDKTEDQAEREIPGLKTFLSV